MTVSLDRCLRMGLGIGAGEERRNAGMRELGRRAFPELDVVLEDVSASIGAARGRRRRQAAATETAALRRARAERAARTS
ncbi:hypothetical protein ACWEPR_39330, partial [Streptomyces sp. NPDC004290]